MSIFKSNAITLGYGSTPTNRSFTVLSFEDDDIELIKLNKTLLTRSQIEKFIGYRKKYRIRFNKLSTTDLDYLYSFTRSDIQKITFTCDGGSGTFNSITLPNNITSVTAPSIFENLDTITALGITGSAISDGGSDSTSTVALSSDTFGSNFTNTALTISRTKTVRVIDEDMAIELFGGFVEAPSLILEFEDASLTSVSTTRPPHRAVSNTNSANYIETSKKGVTTNLIYNYGDGEVARNFSLNLADSYSLKNQREDFEYIDRNRDRKNLGFYQLFNLEFGAFGTQAQITKQDDIEWLKEYCLAPTKKISIYGLLDSDSVICDFDEVTYEQVGSVTYGKSTGLRFLTKDMQTTNLLFPEYWQSLSFNNWENETTVWENLTG